MVRSKTPGRDDAAKTVLNLIDTLSRSSLKDRAVALDDLIYLLEKRNNADLTRWADDTFHDVLEALFQCSLNERHAYLHGGKSRTTASSIVARLSKSAKAVSLVVSLGVSKFKRKTTLALVDHITQALPGPDQDFVSPLEKDYIKSLLTVSCSSSRMEQIAGRDGSRWEVFVNFCTDFIFQKFDSGDHGADNLPRGSPVPGSIPRNQSGFLSSSSSSQRPYASSFNRSVLCDVFECLRNLLLVENANVCSLDIGRISMAAIQVLRFKDLGISHIQPFAFSVLNTLLITAQSDCLESCKSIARDLVPLATYWWQGERAPKDELLLLLRDEVLKAIYLSRFLFEHLLGNPAQENFRRDVDGLAETLWFEYARRDQTTRLELDDVCFSPNNESNSLFETNIFTLRPHNVSGERKWAGLECVALLDSLLTKQSPSENTQSKLDEQPRKKRRTVNESFRLRQHLRAGDIGTQITALQMIPFLIVLGQPSLETLQDLVPVISTFLAHKHANVASWAMIACASCVQDVKVGGDLCHNTWNQIWHLAVNSLRLPGTSRASCVLVDCILKTGLIPYQNILTDINSIITQNGPALLVDSSISLMQNLLQIRNTRLINASQSTFTHIIHWVFSRWKPDDIASAAMYAIHVHPTDLVNLLGACCGASVPFKHMFGISPSGPIHDFKKSSLDMEQLMRYLLLLDTTTKSQTMAATKTSDSTQEIDTAGSQMETYFASKKLVAELLQPKLSDLESMCASWFPKANQVAKLVTIDRVQSLVLTCLIATMMMSRLGDLSNSTLSDISQVVMELVAACLSAVQRTIENQQLVESVLKIVQKCLPRFSLKSLTRLAEEEKQSLQVFSIIANALEECLARQASQNDDMMDIDEDFESQISKTSTVGMSVDVPRYRTPTSSLVASVSFSDTYARLKFVAMLHRDPSQLGMIPSPYADYILTKPIEEFLACRDLLVELLESDLTMKSSDAFQLFEKVGEIISQGEFATSQTALCSCLDLVKASRPIWMEDQSELVDMVDDIFVHFVTKLFPHNMLSSNAKGSLMNVLVDVMKVAPNYGVDIGMPSCHTTILAILRTGSIRIKHMTLDAIVETFGFRALTDHETAFVDVMDSLPVDDPTDAVHLAIRLKVLCKLACRWPTLLILCLYHIFETPASVEVSIPHATRCVSEVSRALQLASSTELFSLFSSQLLFTWLQVETVESIPFSVFGFSSLHELLDTTQSEASAIMIMRGQTDAVNQLAQTIGSNMPKLIQENFTKIVAYSIFHDSHSSQQQSEKPQGDGFARHVLGDKLFSKTMRGSFTEIVGVVFLRMDQEGRIENYLAKDANLKYAADAMVEMKGYSHSQVQLPRNQQPNFQSKRLVNYLLYLCQIGGHTFGELWTPALVVAITRKLLNTVDPILGSLHACAVLRKIRIMICLAGPAAYESYPLEMLLHSLRSFVIDAECADDALGISQYLISHGSEHLSRYPSFMAGYTLSTMASIRVFIESNRASTTQEGQFAATKIRVQTFHKWLSRYLSDYSSTTTGFTQDSEYREAFKSITNSSLHIQKTGNAEKDTFESKLLLDILEDGDREDSLLNDSARELALDMLGSEFNMPSTSQNDIVETDEYAVKIAPLVWKSCQAQPLGKSYLAWAGRVIGRSFATSGQVPWDLLKESKVLKYTKVAPENAVSECGIIRLLQKLTTNPSTLTAGLAELSLRLIVSESIIQGRSDLERACQQTLRDPLLSASFWGQYEIPHPQHDEGSLSKNTDDVVFYRDSILSSRWLFNLSDCLIKKCPDSILLKGLSSLILKAKGFAAEAFPFIVHLVLKSQIETHQMIKRSLSEAMNSWFSMALSEGVGERLQLLINTLLYLRTQKYPNEKSIADRAQWLTIDYATASIAATKCGMYKTALLFAELATPETKSRSSRRSSAISHVQDLGESLLTIFENIDDPDIYYGLPEEASLSNVLNRLEYENNGAKTLAFRGAQYDSHIRQKNSLASQDTESLIKALGTLGLSGLSQSLLKSEQSLEGSSASMESAFVTARKLEMWTLPVPSAAEHSRGITLYKTYQTLAHAREMSVVEQAIKAGLGRTMKSLVGDQMNAANIRRQLGTLAALTELDDVLMVQGQAELEQVFLKFCDRKQWMRRGRYDDISQILSCRETTVNMLNSQNTLRSGTNLSLSDSRQMQIRCMLMASDIYRFHQATQESLNISMSLNDLIAPCEALGLNVNASIQIEAASSLWDHGEMMPSIRILQTLENNSASLKKQSISVSRADLLSKIGHQVSVARLEKPQDIQKEYLEPALKELKGKGEGQEAGQVFHQFATFCDQQLQNSDSLQDLARLQSLKKGKSDEVEQLKSIITNTKDSQIKHKYLNHLARAEQWLKLDHQELQRVELTRTEFVRLSLENYLLSLAASDEYNNDALRFTALWLERSGEDTTNAAVRKHLAKVPTRKFAPLVNQLSSRLQNHSSEFQTLLARLLLSICVDHPYHGMYQIWSGTKTKPNSQDEVARSRLQATSTIADHLIRHAPVASIWHGIDRTSLRYYVLALEREPSRYKSGAKIPLNDSPSARSLHQSLVKYAIPPPTLQIELAADKDYSRTPKIVKLEPHMSIASGVSAPKILTVIGDDGQRYKQLVKGGNDDLRQDAIMEQVFAAVSSLLKHHRVTQQRNLGIRTYKVLPLTTTTGLIEFVADTIPLHEFLMPAHERYHPKDLRGSQCRKEIASVQDKSVDVRVNAYRRVIDRFRPVMRYFFMENFQDPDDWFARRLAYTRSTAAISMLGHVLGLGDRHGHNILLDSKTGEVVHIDLGIAFEMGRVLPVPELVPFRLTRDIVDGMGITGTEGVFRRCCEFTLDALREENYSIMTILDVLRYDPLYSWSISPVRLAKLQRREEDGTAGDFGGDDQNNTMSKRGGGVGAGVGVGVGMGGAGRNQTNEPSEADRALEVVQKKLSKTMSVTATVNDLINQAADDRNLAVLYSGWAAYA